MVDKYGEHLLIHPGTILQFGRVIVQIREKLNNLFGEFLFEVFRTYSVGFQSNQERSQE